MNIEGESEKQSLINTFVNSIYVYADKMVIVFNYKDGEKLVDFDDVTSALEKENADKKRCKARTKRISLATAYVSRSVAF